MRKQYHFRPGPNGLLAWDVTRLASLARGLPHQLLALAAIGEIDEPYWAGGGQAMTCREVAEHARLIEQADLGFPIILSPDGRVMDGMHRVLKALIAGHTHITAVRLTVEPPPDYVGMDPESLPYDD